MVRQNDQVFQLSLTEIAFTIAFLLLLLLGYLVYEAQSDRQAAEAELAKVRTTERATDALTAVKSELLTMLQGAGIANPDEVVSKLSDVEQARSERNQLRQRVDDLEAQLTALIELKKQLEQAAAASRPDVTLDAVLSALVLREEVRAAVEQSEQGAYETAMRDKQMMETVRQALSTTTELRRQLKEMLGRDLQPGQEGQAIQEVVAAAKSFGELAKGGQSSEMIKKENTDLRGQVAFLKNRLDADGGRDYPPAGRTKVARWSSCSRSRFDLTRWLSHRRGPLAARQPQKPCQASKKYWQDPTRTRRLSARFRASSIGAERRTRSVDITCD